MDIVFISVSVILLALLCAFLYHKDKLQDERFDHIESFLYYSTREEGEKNDDDNSTSTKEA